MAEATPDSPTYALPPNQRVYAVGDIHGRADLLEDMLELVAVDARYYKGDARLVFLGDYLDRGPYSKDVLDILSKGKHANIPFTALRGNHEDIVLRFFEDHSVAPGWFHYGGLQTLRSYGFQVPNALQDFDDIFAYRKRLQEAMPPAHREFLHQLPLHARFGDYFFAHAGVHPEQPLEGQDAKNYMWMREPFLSSTKPMEAMVVHGHSIRLKPEVRPNRIGIDTGAYVTGRLTCLVIEGTETRFLST